MELDIRVEVRCEYCNEGKMWVTKEHCHICGGSGSMLTDLGEDILRMLKRRGFVPGVK